MGSGSRSSAAGSLPIANGRCGGRSGPSGRSPLSAPPCTSSGASDVATIRTRPEGSHRRTLRTSPGRSWVATTISGVALLVLLGVHMVANHFVVRSVGGLRSYRQVLEYMRHPAILTTESLFLLVVTFHSMLGLPGIVLDLDPPRRAQRWIAVGRTVLGVLTLAYGYFLIGTLASRA